MIKIIFVTIILFILGCTPIQKKTPSLIPVKNIEKSTLMHTKVNSLPFAKTSKASISIEKPEEQRSEFRLYINSPNATKIRILNIKPKYKDGIWLKKGRYHIELSAHKYTTYKKWIALNQDTNLTISLERKKNVSMGSITWKKQSGVKYINGLYWQDQAVNKKNKMNWDDAKKYCQTLVIKNGSITLDDFVLPSESELLSLSKYNSSLEYSGNICWSSSSDAEHTNFAKYVYINSKKTGWYNKNGSTYVRCVSRRNYSKDLSLLSLAKLIEKEKKYTSLNALERAVQIKYGDPIVRNVVYNSRKKTLAFTLQSQKYDSNKNYFYKKTHVIPMKFHPRSVKFTPEVTFDIINDKLVFKSIKDY